MTNDEAIYVLKNTAFLGWSEQTEKVSEAVRMAIEALERETSGDAISRQDAIRAVKHAWAKGLEPSQYIEDLPSVQPDIIACGDCKHYIPHDKRCGYWNHGVKPLEWCCHAERRTDG